MSCVKASITEHKTMTHKAAKYIVTVLAALTLGCGLAFAGPMLDPAADNQRIEVAQQPVVKVAGSHVEITVPGNEPRQLAVFALTGQLVKNVTVHPGTTTIELPAGYYIVKCDRLSQRVIVR